MNPSNPIPKKGKPRYSQSDIVAALHASGGMVYIAAEKLGCHPDTIYARAAKEKPIADAIANARGKMLDIAESSLKRAVINGEAWAVCFALKTIGKNRGYTERIDVSFISDIERELARLGLSTAEGATREAESNSNTERVN